MNFQILQRTILFLIKQNENISLKTKGKNILLIDPDFWKLDFYSFNKVDEMVEIGYNEAKKILKYTL